MSEIEKYKSALDKRERELEAEIERLKRSLSRVREKKLAPEKFFKTDSKSVRVRRELGEDIPKRAFPTKKSSHVFSPEKIEETGRIAKEASDNVKKSKGFFSPLIGGDE